MPSKLQASREHPKRRSLPSLELKVSKGSQVKRENGTYFPPEVGIFIHHVIDSCLLAIFNPQIEIKEGIQIYVLVFRIILGFSAVSVSYLRIKDSLTVNSILFY